ncbi:hypothetical protein OIO90_004558 [Microbotryomycetes sp. JL221]|nr:hypothetical protein OIO90_004558 [Microbotryomycetes sp. JL221]
MAVPNPDTLHDIHFGSSFRLSNDAAGQSAARPGSANVHGDIVALRYSNKPGSLDSSRAGKIWSSDQRGQDPLLPVNVYATFASNSSSTTPAAGSTDVDMTGLHGFVGKAEDAREFDCVLVWDDDLQSFALERINHQLKLTFDRENQHYPSSIASPESTKRKPPPVLPTSSPKLGSSPLKRPWNGASEDEANLSSASAVPSHLRGRQKNGRNGNASDDGSDWRTAPNSPIPSSSSRNASAQKKTTMKTTAEPEVEDFGDMSFGEDNGSIQAKPETKNKPLSLPKQTPATSKPPDKITESSHDASNRAVRFESPAMAVKSLTTFEKALQERPPSQSSTKAATGSSSRTRSTSPKKGSRPTVSRKSVPQGALIGSSSEEEDEEEEDEDDSSSSDEAASESGIPEGYLVKPGSVLSTGVAGSSSRSQTSAAAKAQAPQAPNNMARTQQAPASASRTQQLSHQQASAPRPHPQVSMKRAVPQQAVAALKDSDGDTSDSSEDDDDDDDDEYGDSDMDDLASDINAGLSKPVVSSNFSSPNKAGAGIGKGKGGPRRGNKLPSRPSYASKIPKSSTSGQPMPGMRGQKGLMAAQNEAKRREEMEMDVLPDSSDED